MTRSTRVVVAILAVCLLAAGAALVLGRSSRDSSPIATTALPAAPSPVIGRPRRTDPAAADARAAAQRFLGPYLRYLYGRARPGAVSGTTAAVARELRRGQARSTPAQAQRRPRVAGLEVTLQTPGSAVAAATIADGGPAPYRIVIGLERRDGRWLVSDLGND